MKGYTEERRLGLAKCIAQQVIDLVHAHIERIEEAGRDSEKGQAKCSFAVQFPAGVSVPKVSVKIGYASRASDEREAYFEDPNDPQMALPFEGGDAADENRKVLEDPIIKENLENQWETRPGRGESRSVWNENGVCLNPKELSVKCPKGWELKMCYSEGNTDDEDVIYWGHMFHSPNGGNECPCSATFHDAKDHIEDAIEEWGRAAAKWLRDKRRDPAASKAVLNAIPKIEHELVLFITQHVDKDAGKDLLNWINQVDDEEADDSDKDDPEMDEIFEGFVKTATDALFKLGRLSLFRISNEVRCSTDQAQLIWEAMHARGIIDKDGIPLVTQPGEPSGRKHPFQWSTGVVNDEASRKAVIDESGIEELQLILADSIGAPLQKKLRQRAEARLKKLQKEANGG